LANILSDVAPHFKMDRDALAKALFEK
jgi:hypothetical protein